MNVMTTAGHFQVSGEVSDIKPFGTGIINDTYRVDTREGNAYLLQRVNTEVFKKPEEVQHNIERVTAYLKEQIVRENGDPMRETLTLIPAAGGETWYRDEQDRFWRMYAFIDHTSACGQPASLNELYETGLAFGRFERRLSGFPVDSLHETIPAFHDTVDRVTQFMLAMDRDACGRKKTVVLELVTLMQCMDRADLFEKEFEGDIQKRTKAEAIAKIMLDFKVPFERALKTLDIPPIIGYNIKVACNICKNWLRSSAG